MYMYVLMYVSMCLHKICVCICIPICICICVCICMCIRIRICVCICIYIYIYAYVICVRYVYDMRQWYAVASTFSGGDGSRLMGATWC